MRDRLPPLAQARTGRRARLRRLAALAAIDHEEIEMTPEELEIERAALVVELEADGPVGDELRERIAAVAAADAARPLTPIDQAIAEALAELVELSDVTPAPGLSVRLNGPEWVDVLDGDGVLVGRLALDPIRRREAEIDAARRGLD